MDNSGFANDSGVLGGSNQVKSTHIYICVCVKLEDHRGPIKSQDWWVFVAIT